MNNPLRNSILSLVLLSIFIISCQSNQDKPDLTEKLVQRLAKLIGNVALINNNEGVFDVLNTLDKAFKLIPVENILFQTIRKAFFSLLNPLFGRMARKDENVGNRRANVILRLVVVTSKFANRCQHRASFARLCWCDRQNIDDS